MNTEKRSIHFGFSFGEASDGKCSVCGTRTVLVSFYGDASVDSEPFASDETADDSQEYADGMEIPDCVEVHDEISGHFCLKCQELTSLWFNGKR